MKQILVVGSGGQDGRLLAERLQTEGHRVFGVERSRLSIFGDTGDIRTAVDISDFHQVRRLVEETSPEEAYYLAAHHHSAEDLDENIPGLFEQSFEVHVQGLVNLLDALRASSPHCRVFYAASSHVFGYPQIPVQSESTPLEPRCVYGITKVAGMHTCRFYRERHGLHVSVGILYNHESPYRARKYVSQRIVHGALEALASKQRGHTAKLTLGNLSATADWGYAPDYVDAMARIVRQDEPRDFVVATGTRHTVRDFVASAFGQVGLDWSAYVEERPGLVRKAERTLIGDASALHAATGWQPSVDFDEMVKRLLDGAQKLER